MNENEVLESLARTLGVDTTKPNDDPYRVNERPKKKEEAELRDDIMQRIGRLQEKESRIDRIDSANLDRCD